LQKIITEVSTCSERISLMTMIWPYNVECEKCGHTEWRNKLLSYNSNSPIPDIELNYEDGCPKCGDIEFDKDR